MRYRYFVHFRHGISVFANFSYGIAVLGTLNVPLLRNGGRNIISMQVKIKR